MVLSREWRWDAVSRRTIVFFLNGIKIFPERWYGDWKSGPARRNGVGSAASVRSPLYVEEIPGPMDADTPNTPLPTRAEVIAALQQVEDPELFLDIWFLGLVYTIDIAPERISIEMTFTSPLCPAGPMLVDDVKTKVGGISGGRPVEVTVVFTPPWEPSDEVKGMLGML